MEVCGSTMGPERVFPSSEDELGEDERPVEGALLPTAVVWSGGEETGEDGGETGVEEDEEGVGGYYYQPLNQEEGLQGSEQPEDEDEGEEPAHPDQLQHRLEVMGLHLPDAPPPDSDEEENPEEAAAQRSRASIPMDADHVELVKRTMAAVALPSLGVPPWAQEISDDQWKDLVEHTLQSRQSAAALRMKGRSNVPGP